MSRSTTYLYALSPDEVEAYEQTPPSQWIANELFERRGGYDPEPPAAGQTRDQAMRTLSLDWKQHLLHLSLDPEGYDLWRSDDRFRGAPGVERRTAAVRGRLGRAVRGAEVYAPAEPWDELGFETRWLEAADVRALAADLAHVTPETARIARDAYLDEWPLESWEMRWQDAEDDNLLLRLIAFYRTCAETGAAVVVATG